jgi:hypothetical protein
MTTLQAPATLTKDTDRAAWLKAHAVQGDALFALDRSGRLPLPELLVTLWSALLADVTTAKKETATHRRERDRVRSQHRVWLDYASRFDRREDTALAA